MTFAARSHVIAPFIPVTVTYTSGSGNETVPTGCTNVRIRLYGGAGGASRNLVSPGYGGGGGGFVEWSGSIAPGEVLAYVVGTGGAGRTGSQGDGTTGTSTSVTNSTVWVINPPTAFTGTGATTVAVGTGGAASGGNVTNTAGTSGSVPVGSTGGAGGNCAGPSGGAGGAGRAPVNPGDNGTAAGGGGGGGSSNQNGGDGARGEIEFYFT